MNTVDGQDAQGPTAIRKPVEEFVAYCEIEFDRRLNAGESFDEAAYRRAMALVVEHLTRMEAEGMRR